MPTVSDLCDAKPSLDYDDAFNLDECGLGTVTRTWTARDCAGNSSTASQTVTIFDDTAPVIDGVGEPFKVECPDEVVFSMPTVSDLCDENPSLDYDDVYDLDDCGLGTITRNWTATDCAGNTSNASQEATIEDNLDPVINGVGDDFAVECPEGYEFSMPTASDLCDQQPSLDYDDAFNLDDCGLGTVTRTWTARDCAGNTATASQTVTIFDNTAPVIDGVGDAFKVECPDEVVFSMPTVSDLCDEQPSLNYVDVYDLDECGLGTVTRTWTARDCAGNTSNASQEATIEDNTAPEIEGVGDDFTVECPEEYMFSEPTATDECDKGGINFDCLVDGSVYGFINFGAPTGQDENGYNMYGLGTSSFPAVDYSLSFNNELNRWEVIGSIEGLVWYSNVATTSPSCTIGDWLIPDGIVCEIINVYCMGSGVSLTHNDVSDLDECGLGTVTRTWTATDCAGNTSNASQTVTIQDTVAPEFTYVPVDLTVECDEDAPEQEATAVDDCDNDVQVEYEEYPVYTPWRAGSTGGNGVVDLSGAPSAILVVGSDNSDDDSPEYFTFATTAVKGVTLSFDWEFFTNDDDALFDPFVYSLDNGATYTSIYDNGGAATGSFSLAIPAGTRFQLGVLTTDNCCGEAIVAMSNINFEVTPLECPIRDCLIREYVATDCAGNKAYAQQFIYFEDTTAPTLNEGAELPGDISNIVACFEDRPTLDEEAIIALFTDNCGEVELMYTEKPLGDDCSWAVMYSITIKDDCGNALEPFKVFYNGGDTVAPTLNDGAELPQGETGLQCKSEGMDVGVPKASVIASLFSDNCSETVTVTGPVMTMTGDDCDWTVWYTYQVQDDCGNEADDVVITYSGADTMEPTLEGELPGNNNGIEACKPEGDEIYEYAPTAEEFKMYFLDNCTAQEDLEVIVSPTCWGDDCSWILAVEYTVKDACGNATEVYKINFQGMDTTAPVPTGVCDDEVMTLTTEDGADCPADAMISLNIGDILNAADNSWTVAGIAISEFSQGLFGCFTDNCTATEDLRYLVVDKSNTGDSCSATLTITFNVLDACDNAYEGFVCTFIINDDTAPVLECPEDQYLGFNPDVDDNGIPYGLATKATYTDNCQPEGETEDYSDVISSSISQDASEITFYCTNPNNGLELLPFTQTGFDGSGYATYAYVGANQFNRSLIYNEIESRWEVYSSGEVRFYNNSVDVYPSCDESGWTLGVTACTQAGPECNTSNSEWQLVRTFTADDGCGNVGTCSVTYTWTTSNDLPTGANANDIVFSDSKNADSDDPLAIVAGTTANQVDFDLEFKAYPVPFDKEVTISYNFNFDSDISIQVFDTKGILVKTLSANRHFSDSESKVKVNMAGMPNQMYYVKVITNQGAVTKKILSKDKR